MSSYPETTLANARRRRDEAKALLASGIDPGQQRKLGKITKALSDAATFDSVAEEYLAKKMRGRDCVEHEEENAKLKRIAADLSLDKAMLQDVLSKSSEACPQAFTCRQGPV